jgi:phosphoglycolate phosphatase-like HAD superfamily hydrolase
MLKKFNTIIFDCDGVILDSNKIKTDAFYYVAKIYGENIARQFKKYHILHGGISRYEKFNYLLTNILQKPPNKKEIEMLCSNYSEEVINKLLKCSVADFLDELKKDTTNTINWMMVSGSDEVELRYIIKQRKLDSMFNKGIFGSPDSKKQILKRELESQNLVLPALYLGDTAYDHQAASHCGIDFIFVSNWTEFIGWEKYCEENNILAIKSVFDIKALINDNNP